MARCRRATGTKLKPYKKSMNKENNQTWLVLAAVALLSVTAYSCWAMNASAGRLQESLANEQECQLVVDDIHRLKDRPGFAALTIDSPRTITARAEAAGKQANLAASALVRIEPQSAVRLGDSPYRMRPTRLELRQVTLEQLIRFSHFMIDESQGTTLRDLRLTLSDGSADRANDANQWNAELVLTQLIFAPTSR